MKAEEQTKLNETLSKVFKLDREQLATLYNEAGDLTDLSVVVEADERRIAKFKSDNLSQRNRGIKEGAEKLESALREKYDVESDLIGVELVDSIINAETAKVQKASPSDVTKHPEYVKLEASIAKQLRDKDKEWQGKLDNREREFNRDKLFEKVKDRALVNLESRKPLLPTDPKRAQAWKEIYLRELREGNYQESEDGTPIVLDKEGNVLKDAHGNPITFEEYERGISDKYFEYPAAQQRSSSGNQQSTQQGSGGEPRTAEEALMKLKDPKITPADRKKFTEIYDKLKENKR